MRRFGIALVAGTVVAVAAPVGGQEVMPNMTAYAQPGQRVKVTLDEKGNQKTVFAIAGAGKGMDEARGKALVYVDETLETPKNEARPTRLKRTYEKAQLTTAGKTNTLDVEGKTVLIEKAGDKYTFTVGGKPVSAEAEKLLGDEFNRVDMKDPVEAMSPKTPVKPGDTWKIDVTDLRKMMGSAAPEFDKDKVTATGKLVKTYQQDGRQYGVMEFAVEAPITGLGPKSAFALKEGKLVVTMTADGCIDGTSPAGKTQTGLKFTVAGASGGVDVKVEVDLKGNRIYELLPKK